MGKRFQIRFIPEAEKEYQKLDGSTKKFVNIAIAKMEERADKIGEELTSKHGINLKGCRKIKLRKLGIRVVYRIKGNKAEIAEIISIGKREDNEVYRTAYKRLKKILEES